jgi:hypothetical protein
MTVHNPVYRGRIILLLSDEILSVLPARVYSLCSYCLCLGVIDQHQPPCKGYVMQALGLVSVSNSITCEHQVWPCFLLLFLILMSAM